LRRKRVRYALQVSSLDALDLTVAWVVSEIRSLDRPLVLQITRRLIAFV
jgi:hypothetical protein